MVLWSPLGAEKCPENYVDKIYEQLDELPLRLRMMLKTFRYFFNKNYTPFYGMRKAGRGLGGIMLRKFLKYRLVNVSEEDFNKIYNYLFQILMQKGSSELALNIMFKHIFMTPTPIIDSLEDLSFK